MTVGSRLWRIVAALIVVATVVGALASPATAAGTASLTGLIVFETSADPAGEGEAIARLELRNGVTGEWTQVTTQPTDSTGRYTFSGLEAGYYRIIASATTPGVYPDRMSVTGYSLAAGEARDVGTIDLDAYRTFSGRILMPDGSPATSSTVTVKLEHQVGSGTVTWQEVGQIPLQADGSFSLSGLLPTSHRTTVIGITVPLVADTFTTSLHNGSISGVTFQTRRAHTISGVVHLGELGVPSGADTVRVTLYPPSFPVGPCWGIRTAWTDASGAFSFSGLCAGTYSGVATYMLDGRYGYVAWGPVTVDGNDVDGLDLVVPGNVTIEGEITDSTGNPLGGIDVIAYRFDEDLGDWVIETTGETSSQGTYLLAPVEAGYYAVLFDDPQDQYSATWWGGAAWSGEPDLVYVDEPVILDEYLDRVARFRGYILDLALAEAPNVTVEALIQDPDSGTWISTGYAVWGYVVPDSGGQGFYEFTDIPPGDYRFRFTYSGSKGTDSYVTRTYHFEPGDRWWHNAEFVLPALPPEQIAFTRALYQDFLGRWPYSWESRNLVERLVSGQVSRYGAATELSRSDEWITSVITTFYHDTLNREPDEAGLRSWAVAARNGMPIAQIAAAFYSSPEYFQTVGNSDYTTWVTDLYQKLLLRAPDAAGLAYWVRALERGVSRDAVAMGFYQSQEKLGVRIAALYERLLGRDPEPGAVAHWSPFVASHGDLVLAAAIAGSQEYFNRAQPPPTGEY